MNSKSQKNKHDKQSAVQILSEQVAVLARLNQLSSRLWIQRSLDAGLGETLHATIELLGADKGNIQVMNEHGVLVIAAHKGFGEGFLDFFREVSVKDDSACARALRSGSRIMIEDVETDDEYRPLRAVARTAGYRAVQSTPLLGRDGKLLGMLSTHWSRVHRPTELECSLLDLYARQAADFIERLKIDETMYQSESRFRELVERSPFGTYVVDSQLRILHMNEAGQHGAFQNVRPVIGRDLGEAMRILWPESVAVEIIAIFRHTLETGIPYGSLDFLNPRADVNQTEAYEWELHRVTLPDGQYGVICYYFDSTKLRHTEQALRASEERLRLANLATNEAIWDWDVVNDTVVWNQNVDTLFGWSDAVNTRFSAAWWVERVHPEDRSRVTEHFLAAVNDPMIASWAEEYRFKKMDGSYAYVFDRAYAVRDTSGKPLRMLGTMLDITERKHAEFRLQQFTQDLERQVTARTAELLESQEHLRMLATELSLAEQRERKRLASELHDHLAQLLVLIRFKLSLAKQGPNARRVDMIYQADSLVSKALTYTRELVAELSPSVLHEFGLPAALRWLGEQMKQFGLTVIVQLEAPETLPLSEDQAILLFQSTRELLINTAKHAGTKDATVRLTQEDGILRITVHDQGRGFDPTGTQKRSSTAGSSTFGLFSIRERMYALGGRFEMTSASGKGATAELSLPYQSVSRPPVKSVASPSRLVPASTDLPAVKEATVCRLLLVDDHAMMREGLRSLLDAYADIQVVGEASDGIEAVRLVETLQPRVVLMDINMPRMNGIEATTRIKTRWPEIIVIGLSVNASADNEGAMKKAGALRLITKEVAVEELHGAIQGALKDSGISVH